MLATGTLVVDIALGRGNLLFEAADRRVAVVDGAVRELR